jgi:NDP-sugar pyrophosphorylase family protein
MSYRSLTDKEISFLVSQGCISENWSEISVHKDFSALNIKNTRFEGKVKLGVISRTLPDVEGITRKCGIYNSYIRNCEISDNVCITNVKNLANYIIGDNVLIENVGSLVMDGESSFGNGVEVDSLNEGGGRGLPIFDRLTSQIAYLAVLYRHDREFTARLMSMIGDYVKSKRSSMGVIESNTSIRDVLIIRDVWIGSYAVISASTLLEEGTIVSCKEAPAFVGEGVIAKKFIILSGSSVDGNALIEKTFAGQGVKIGKQYSAENSLFFANSEAFHGEGCSIFAGPYTVTHHKSTLLIACLFSFYNAGSGTNQSNHMYKLGPVHQGILERGSKTGSFAYLLLPCRIGAYSVVMGKHFTNFDSSDFPFSYITEEKGKSELTPAMNIFTVGTRRDSEKWSTRDRRKDPEKLDLINFELFNPYVVGRMLNGISILNDLVEKTPKTQDFINYKGINIHRLLLKTSRKYYEMALKSYIGNEVVKKLGDIDSIASADEPGKRLKSSGNEGVDKWIDVCGMFAPASKIQTLTDDVKSGKLGSISDLSGRLREINDNYERLSWEWCSEMISKHAGTSPENMPVSKLIEMVTDWRTNTTKLNNMVLKDAEKEFDEGTRLGFGIDGDENTRDLDFNAVRGEFQNNKFVSGLQKEIQNIELKADKLISVLKQLE